MRNIDLKDLKNRLGPSHAILATTIAVVVAWIFMTINVLNNNYRLQRQVDDAQLNNQITELENQNLELEQLYYKTDEYIELSARSLMGKSQPGEHLVILPKVAKSDDSNSQAQIVSQKSNFDQWMDFLLGKH